MRILIAPPSDSARESLNCLKAWSRAGLIDPFCWWQTGEAGDDDSLDVAKVVLGKAEEMLLSEGLKDARPDDVAVVAFCPTPESSPVTGAFSRAVETKVDRARQVLAYTVSRPTECTMVVVPSAIAQPVPPELFRAEWAANVYVAPEDRDHPQGVNALAANEARLATHAAHAIATIAGLWRGLGDERHAVLDLLRERQPALAPAPIQVVRCFTRGIEVGYLADHVAATVFMPDGSWPNPDPERFDRIGNAAKAVADGARLFLDKHRQVLGPTEFEPYRLPADEKMGLLEALRFLIKTLIDRLRRRPYEIAVAKAHEVHDWMARKVEALDGGATGIKVLRAGERERKGRAASSLDEALERPIHRPDGPVANTWSDLRGLAFSLIDGRELPAGLDGAFLDRGAKRALVTDPALLAPDPQDGYSLVSGDRIAAVCDPLALDPEFAPPAEADPPAGEQSGAETGRDAIDPGEPEAAPQRPSLLWLVGVGLARNLTRVRKEAEALRARTAVELDPESEEAKQAEEDEKQALMQRSRARLRRLFKVVAVTLVISVLIGVAAWNQLPLAPRIPVLLSIPLIWLFVIANEARKLLVRERLESRAIAQREIDALNNRILAAIREGDAVRLERRYGEYLDWAELVGWFVHHPWVGDPLAQVDVDASLAEGGRPAAFQAAIARSDPDWLAGLGDLTRDHVFQRAWLSDLYSINQDEILQRASGPSRFIGGDVSEAVPDPAGDASEDPESPRRTLLRSVRRGDYRHIGDNPMTTGLLERLDKLPLDSVAAEVEIREGEGASSEALPLSPSWFSPPKNLESLIRRLRPTVVRVRAANGDRSAIGTGMLLAGEELVASALHVVEGAESIVAVMANGDEIAVEIEAEAADKDLVLLRLAEPSAQVGAVLGRDDDLDQGTPVVTLGFQGALEGEASLSWGLITATDRQVRLADEGPVIDVIEAGYQSAGGSSGGPVFNLEGEVVGLHIGARPGLEPDLDHLSHAVSVGALRELIAGGAGKTATVDGRARPSPAGDAPRPARRRRSRGPTPSGFFDELLVPGSEEAFLPGHWQLSGEHNRVDQRLTLPRVEAVGSSRLVDYCTGNRFLRPLNLMVHRIDLAKPVSPDLIVSCAAFDEVG